MDQNRDDYSEPESRRVRPWTGHDVAMLVMAVGCAVPLLALAALMGLMTTLR